VRRVGHPLTNLEVRLSYLSVATVIVALRCCLKELPATAASFGLAIAARRQFNKN
jgi:hypothetical protein